MKMRKQKNNLISTMIYHPSHIGLSGNVLFTDRKTGIENKCTIIESALLWTLTNGQSPWSNLELQALVNGTVMKADLSAISFHLYINIILRSLDFHPRSQWYNHLWFQHIPHVRTRQNT